MNIPTFLGEYSKTNDDKLEFEAVRNENGEVVFGGAHCVRKEDRVRVQRLIPNSPMSTLTDLVASQDNLIQEAALALPHSFSHCTYPLGQIRQAVYLCLTCAQTRGICGSCSIACHTDHEQLELFPKRNFRCDCPTTALSHPCTLMKRSGAVKEDVNEYNTYGQNFRGLFCRCGRNYDPKTERETMIQCLTCEVSIGDH